MGCWSRKRSAAKKLPRPPATEGTSESRGSGMLQLPSMNLPHKNTKVEPAEEPPSNEGTPGESLETVVDWAGVVQMYRFINDKYPSYNDDGECVQVLPGAIPEGVEGGTGNYASTQIDRAAPHRTGSSFYIRQVPTTKEE